MNLSPYGEIIAPGTIRFQRLLPGPIERVWEFLTDPEKRGLWLARGPLDQHVGGSVELHFHNSKLSSQPEETPERFKQYDSEVRMTGTVTRCDPPRLLSYTWESEGPEPSEVTFELAPQGEEVLLTLTHKRLLRGAEMQSVAGGWHTHLGFLTAHSLGQAPGAFWATYAHWEADYGTRLGL